MIKFCLAKGTTMEVSERLNNISISIDCNSVWGKKNVHANV